MRFTLTSLFALAAATLAFAQPQARGPRTFNPSVVAPGVKARSAAVSEPPLTNAKRFAMGLPPLQPRAHRRRSPHGGSPVLAAPRSLPSSSSITCNILVSKADGSGAVGYVAPAWNEWGEYGVFTSDKASALKVSFTPSGSNTHLQLKAVNGPDASYPNVGAVDGYISEGVIAPTTANYAYIAGTIQYEQITPNNAPADTWANSFSAASGTPEVVESGIWSYDQSSGGLTAVWTNADNSAYSATMIYLPDEGSLAITGNTQMFHDAFDDVPTFYPVTLACIPCA